MYPLFVQTQDGGVPRTGGVEGVFLERLTHCGKDLVWDLKMQIKQHGDRTL
jgi:hypothetical protein